MSFKPAMHVAFIDPVSREPLELREDSLDMMSPAYDHPQKIAAVAKMFEAAGARVDFAGWADNGINRAAVVRATRPAN